MDAFHTNNIRAELTLKLLIHTRTTFLSNKLVSILIWSVYGENINMAHCQSEQLVSQQQPNSVGVVVDAFQQRKLSLLLEL